MHFSDIGMIAQLLALVFAIYAIVASVLGAVYKVSPLQASGRRAVLAVAVFLIIASASLVASFVSRDFGLEYVAEHSSRAMPWYLYRGRLLQRAGGLTTVLGAHALGLLLGGRTGPSPGTRPAHAYRGGGADVH